MELNKRDISALIEAYSALGSLLSGALENIDPDRVMGIKAHIHKLTIHANHFKHVAQSIYQKLENPPPEVPEDREEEEPEEVVIASCDHLWETMEATICAKCGVKKLDWEMGLTEGQEEPDDSSTRNSPEEDG